jgi:hypothetical protein
MKIVLGAAESNKLIVEAVSFNEPSQLIEFITQLEIAAQSLWKDYLALDLRAGANDPQTAPFPTWGPASLDEKPARGRPKKKTYGVKS